MRLPRVTLLVTLVCVLQLLLLLRTEPEPCPTSIKSQPAPSLYGRVKKVGVLIVATGRYVQFISQLLDDLSKHFLVDYSVTAVIFTESKQPSGCDKFPCKVVPHVRYGWPYDTLLRWEAYANASAILSEFDFLFAIDADMRIEGPVGSEIFGPLVGVLHPAYYSANVSDFTYENNNSRSAAYIAKGQGHHYFAGGVSGGEKAAFLAMARTISAGARRDLSEGGFIARWHDESHLNRYMLSHPPGVILSPAYCYPEGWKLPFPRKIIALNKNHKAMRAPSS